MEPSVKLRISDFGTTHFFAFHRLGGLEALADAEALGKRLMGIWGSVRSINGESYRVISVPATVSRELIVSFAAECRFEITYIARRVQPILN